VTFSVHPQGICESTDVGDGTRVWAFAHVLPGAVIGRNANICDHVFIENDVVLGDDVTIKSGVQLWDGVRLADGVFVGPNATFTNDRFPRSKQYPDEFPVIRVGTGASLGANCTILPGVTIGRGAMVGAGAVVTRDVPAHAVVTGNPARVVGYADTPRVTGEPTATEPVTGTVSGVSLHRLGHSVDPRGSLVVADFAADLPFLPRRAFTVFDVPAKDVRGEHAHHRCEQFLMCLVGSVSCVVDDGRTREEYLLDRPDVGLYMPAMTWGTQYRYSPDAVLLVLASHPYDPDDYLRDHDEFLAAATAAAAR
jgi:UDP-2-acetamido-3-amino-2,3-dideoxy-glucuronate N-acetyltransferase